MQSIFYLSKYNEKGFDNEPTRCAACRRAKKEQNRR
ncbi:UNVERIFIED_ORG: hypothetical protein B2H92_12675 [Clostridium botulinum]